MVSLLYRDITPLLEPAAEAAARLCLPADWQMYCNGRNAVLRAGRLTAVLLLRELLAERGEALPPAPLRHGDGSGKPRFADDRYSFSVSHGGAMAAVALGDREEVGVDIEPLSALPAPRRARIAAHFFDPAAAERCEGDPARFTHEWTRLEAAYKAGAPTPPPPRDRHLSTRRVRDNLRRLYFLSLCVLPRF